MIIMQNNRIHSTYTYQHALPSPTCSFTHKITKYIACIHINTHYHLLTCSFTRSLLTLAITSKQTIMLLAICAGCLLYERLVLLQGGKSENKRSYIGIQSLQPPQNCLCPQSGTKHSYLVVNLPSQQSQRAIVDEARLPSPSESQQSCHVKNTVSQSTWNKNGGMK